MRVILWALFIASVLIVWFFLKLPGYAHFADRPDLNGWAASLQSKRGLCCSFADAVTVQDPDVDMDSGHYRVRIDGEWIDVPDEAVVDVPNKYGSAVVWPYQDQSGKTQIRCFLPGAGA